MVYRDACKNCIEGNGGNWTSTNEGDAGNAMDQWLHYCDTKPLGSITPAGGSNSTSSKSIPYEIVTTTLPGYVLETHIL